MRRLTVKGLETLQEALTHTPTLVELHSARAKLLRHAGDVEGGWKGGPGLDRG